MGRSGGAILYDGDPSRSRAGLADDAVAALADAAGAAAAHAGFLHHRSRAVVVNRKAFSEIHLNILCFARFLKVDRTLSMAR
jgi:hypothetical protein